MAKVQRTTNISLEAAAAIERHPEWNVSIMLEEAIWARVGKVQGSTETKEEFLKKRMDPMRAKLEKEFEEQIARQAGLRAPYLERFDRLVSLWRTTAKEKGFGS